MVWGHSEAASLELGQSRNLEFTPKGIYVFLLVVDASILHHVVSHGRMGTIGTNHKVKGHLDLGRSLVGMVGLCRVSLLEPGSLPLKVRSRKLVGKVDPDIRKPLQFVQQQPVEVRSINRKNGLEELNDAMPSKLDLRAGRSLCHAHHMLGGRCKGFLSSPGHGSSSHALESSLPTPSGAAPGAEDPAMH